MSKSINIAIAGIGNCTSSLIQGLFYYKDVKDEKELIPGLMHNLIGGYKISDTKLVAAFDVDKRKVGKDVSEAIFALPNNTKVFCKDIPKMIEKEFGFKPGRITPYRVLYRLEKQGFVKSKMEERRRIYQITEKGKEELLKAEIFYKKILNYLK